jgi:murein DD-endopeptidase MepM/ murein hydrolase activator NlpD
MQSLESILQTIPNVKVIDPAIATNAHIFVDLSEKNTQLSQIDIKNATDFESFIGTILQKNRAKVAYGGYLEKRAIYKRSTIFNDNQDTERNIHIGLDLWIKAGTPVLAALDGKIHSFNYNTGLGNYGPTIIIVHSIENHSFYTLYGHLSIESIEDIEIGDLVKKGQQIASLGDATVNGDYAPHLHFQIIKDLEGNFGDYPGVCNTSKLDFYKQNCPDPNLLLKLHHE